MASTTATSGPTTRHQPLIYYGYWIVGAALVAQFVSAGTQAWASGVFLTPMTEDLGWTRAEFTYAQTFGRFVTAFAGFFIGVYIDRFGGRAIMVIGVTLLGMGMLLTSAVTELWEWIVVRGLVSMLGAALVGNLVANVTLSKWFVEKRGRVLGIATMGVSLGGVILPPLLTPFVDEFGWRAGWRVLAICVWMLGYPVAMLMRRQPEDHGWNPDGKTDEEVRTGGTAAAADLANSLTRGQALRTSTFYVIVISFGLGTIGVGVMLFGLIPFLTDEGFTRTTAALMVTVLAFPAMVVKPIWGWLMDFVPPKLAASLGFATSGVAIVALLLTAKSGSTAGVMASVLLMGIGFGGTIPIQEMIWGTYFGRKHLGSVRGVAMPFALILGAGGPQIVQVYFDRVGNYDGAFLAIAACWALSAILIMTVRKPGVVGPPPEPDTTPLDQPPSEQPPDRTKREIETSLADNNDISADDQAHEDGETNTITRTRTRDYMKAP